MHQLLLATAIICSLLLIIPSTAATSTFEFSTAAALPAATPTAIGSFPVSAVPVNKYYYRNSTNDKGDGTSYQNYLSSLFSLSWTFSLDVFFTADGTSSTSTIHISGLADEVADLTPTTVATKNETTYWDVCFMYLPDILANYDASRPNGVDGGAANFNGSFFNILGLDCGNDLGAYLSSVISHNFTVCGGKDGAGNMLSFEMPRNGTSLVGKTANRNITVFTTPHVLGISPFLVRTDTYTTRINESVTAAKQRTFPIMWVERSRMGEITLDGEICLRALNGSDGTAPKDSTAPKNGAVGTHSDIGLARVWRFVKPVMVVMMLW